MNFSNLGPPKDQTNGQQQSSQQGRDFSQAPSSNSSYLGRWMNSTSDRFKGFIGKQQTQKEVVDSDGNGGGFNDEADQKEGYSDDSFDSGSQKNEQKGQEIKEDIPTHQSYTRNFEGYFCTWKDSNINMKMEMLMYQLFNDPNIAGKGTSFYPQINPNYKVDHPSRYPSMQKLTHSPQLEYYGKISDKSYNDEMGKFDKNGILTTRYIGFYSKSDRFRRFREEVDSYIPQFFN